MSASSLLFFFFFNDTATTEIYTLSLHDALPISIKHRQAASLLLSNRASSQLANASCQLANRASWQLALQSMPHPRSEEHTSELQSQSNLVCRLLLEKKKQNIHIMVRMHQTTSQS